MSSAFIAFPDAIRVLLGRCYIYAALNLKMTYWASHSWDTRHKRRPASIADQRETYHLTPRGSADWIIGKPDRELQWITGNGMDLINNNSFLSLPPCIIDRPSAARGLLEIRSKILSEHRLALAPLNYFSVIIVKELLRFRGRHLRLCREEREEKRTHYRTDDRGD